MAASENRVLTAPLAIIKVNGIPIGKMKNISVSENIRRAKVVGLGSLVPDELPVVEWSGTLSCELMTIDFKKSQIPGAINRIGSIEDFTNNLVLAEDGVDITIMRRAKDPLQDDNKFPNVSNDPNFIQRQIKGKLVEFATVRSAFITREGFNISEGSISSRNTEFEMKNPVLFANF
jgi:hypothetical protein